MKIKFIKDQAGEIDTVLIVNGVEEPFDYIRMINELYLGESFEETEYIGEISEDIKMSLNMMIEKITSVVNSNRMEIEEVENIADE